MTVPSSVNTTSPTMASGRGLTSKASLASTAMSVTAAADMSSVVSTFAPTKAPSGSGVPRSLLRTPCSRMATSSGSRTAKPL